MPLDATPSIKNLCRKRKRRMIGTSETKEAALMSEYSAEY
jgi:hypothetical protein